MPRWVGTKVRNAVGRALCIAAALARVASVAEETAGFHVEAPQRGRVGYLLRRATDALVERGSEHVGTNARLRGLLDAVLAISEDLSLSAMIERLVTAACELVGADAAALDVLAPDTGALSEVVAAGMSLERVAEIRTDPSRFGVLAVTVRTRNEEFGHLYMADKRGGGSFTEEDELLVVALASAAGVAIQNAKLFEAQGRRSMWLVASSEVRGAVLRGATEDELIALVVSEARQASRAVFTALILPGPSDDLVVAASTEPALVGSTLPSRTSIAGRVAADRQAEVLEDIDSGYPVPDLPEDIRARTGHCLIAPLGIDDEHAELGVLVVAYPRDAAALAAFDLDYVVGFAGQVGVALQLAASQLDRERIAILEERERIARDLHDLVIQRLFAAGMTLQSTSPMIDSETARSRLAAVADDLDGTIRELRQAIYQLQAPVLADDFRRDVQHVVDRAVTGSEIKVRTRYVGPAGTQISDRIRPHVLAVVGEGLSNALRHAGAATIDVAVAIEDGRVSVVVDDDGRGIDPAVTRRSGLANLATRASALGGELTIALGARGVGTRIAWSVPD